MQHLLLVGVDLQVTQQHLGGLAGQFHVQHGRVEGFLLDGMPQCVVVQLDQLGLTLTAVNNAGHLAGIAQTAARTRTLLAALESDEFHD